MIGAITGTVAEIEPDRVLIETASGVAYEVVVPPRVLSELPGRGAAVHLFVHTDVREDAIRLFGFGTRLDREVFRTVQSVSGIGPKLALALVGTMSPRAIADALARGDELALSRVPGIGRKTAARLVLELSDKVPKVVATGETLLGARAPSARPGDDVEAALLALGYSSKDAARAIERAAPTEADSVQSLLKRALRELSPG